MFKVKATAIAAAMMFTSAVYAQDADTVVASVNGTDITLGQMVAVYDMAGGEAYAKESGMEPQMLWDTILDQLVRSVAVADGADEDIAPALAARLEVERLNSVAGSVLEDLGTYEPNDEELQAAYDKAVGSVEPVTEFSAAHILVETEEEAKAVKEEVDGGADFAEVAKEKSTGPSGPNGGDLGWFAADQMVAEFSEAVQAMEKGSISDPVQTQFGWHVIKLNDSRTQEGPALEEVRDQLVQLIRREKVAEAIESAVSGAEISKTEDLDPAVLTNGSVFGAN